MATASAGDERCVHVVGHQELALGELDLLGDHCPEPPGRGPGCGVAESMRDDCKYPAALAAGRDQGAAGGRPSSEPVSFGEPRLLTRYHDTPPPITTTAATTRAIRPALLSPPSSSSWVAAAVEVSGDSVAAVVDGASAVAVVAGRGRGRRGGLGDRDGGRGLRRRLGRGDLHLPRARLGHREVAAVDRRVLVESAERHRAGCGPAGSGGGRGDRGAGGELVVVGVDEAGLDADRRRRGGLRLRDRHRALVAVGGSGVGGGGDGQRDRAQHDGQQGGDRHDPPGAGRREHGQGPYRCGVRCRVRPCPSDRRRRRRRSLPTRTWHRRGGGRGARRPATGWPACRRAPP